MKKAMYHFARLFVIGVVSTSILLFSGCNSASQKQDKNAPTAEDAVDTEAVVEELSGYPVPTSYEITKLIYESGSPYILSLSNGPEKAGEYITQRDKVLNLGVYAADLCYATTYMMKQGTMNYLEASKTLVDELGISTNFNTNYAERIENNLDDRDSVILIVSESFSDTWSYLVENKQDILARLVVCGSWIEGIYTTTNIAKTSRDNTKFLEIIAQQKKSLDMLVNLMEPVKELDDVSEIFKGLFDLQDIYEGVGDTLTSDQLERISAKIEALRGSII